MKLNEAVVKFESYLLSALCVSRNTFDAYSRDLKQFLDFIKHEVEEQGVVIWCGQITTDHIKSFLKFLQEHEVHARSRSRKISCLRKFFEYISKDESYGLKENPMNSIVLPKLEKKLPGFLTETETEQLLKTALLAKTPGEERNKIMLYVLYTCGLRISELVNLRTCNIDFSSGFITIDGKGGKERMVPLQHDINVMLQEYLEKTYPQLGSQKSDKILSDLLFPVYYGGVTKALTRQSFWGYLKKLSVAAGIQKDISPHQLRHSLATHLLKNGADLRSLQLLLGHEHLETVQIYTHLETNHLRKIYDAKHPRS
ncbi:site-specific tyrosine recombinase XerD [bacterium]|nr:site-specific tyrosine recombinase XerD [bacterium]